MDREHLYDKTWFKNIILIGLPLIISVLGIVISISANQIVKGVIITIAIILLIVFVIMVVIFSKTEDKKSHELMDLKNNLAQKETRNLELSTLLAHVENNYKTSVYTINSFSKMFELWSKNINSFATNIKTNGVVSDKAWNKIKIMDSICSECKQMISQYCNDYDESKLSVGFISYRKDSDGREWVHLISHSNSESTRPSACKEEEDLSHCLYHYGDLIKRKARDIEVAVNNDEILRIFHRATLECDLNKYEQYIAIPVYCTSNKLLGIFQIVTKYGYTIEDTHENMIKFASRHIVPYSNMIVLVDKIYKGLYISPTTINKEV